MQLLYKPNSSMSLFWETRPTVSKVILISWTLTLLRRNSLDSHTTQINKKDIYWKLADGCRLKYMHTFYLVIIIQLIYPPLVGIWSLLDYMPRMLIFDDFSPDILSSEGKSCFYFKVFVNDLDPWILRLLLPMIFIQSICLLEGSTHNPPPYPGEFILG